MEDLPDTMAGEFFRYRVRPMAKIVEKLMNRIPNTFEWHARSTDCDGALQCFSCNITQCTSFWILLRTSDMDSDMSGAHLLHRQRATSSRYPRETRQETLLYRH